MFALRWLVARLPTSSASSGMQIERPDSGEQSKCKWRRTVSQKFQWNRQDPLMSSWLKSAEISEVRNNLPFANRIQLDFRIGTQESRPLGSATKQANETKQTKQAKSDVYANFLSSNVRFLGKNWLWSVQWECCVEIHNFEVCSENAASKSIILECLCGTEYGNQDLIFKIFMFISELIVCNLWPFPHYKIAHTAWISFA
jgi:hypothetical protein